MIAKSVPPQVHDFGMGVHYLRGGYIFLGGGVHCLRGGHIVFGGGGYIIWEEGGTHALVLVTGTRSGENVRLQRGDRLRDEESVASGKRGPTTTTKAGLRGYSALKLDSSKPYISLRPITPPKNHTLAHN